MPANPTTSTWHGLGAKVTGFGYERRIVLSRVSPAPESAIYASRRSGVLKKNLY